MLSKLVNRQILNHGLRLTKRTASVAAQQKLVVNRNPDVKYQKVLFDFFIFRKYFFMTINFFSFLLIMNLWIQQVETYSKCLIHQLVM
jgi:hypothetical protein